MDIYRHGGRRLELIPFEENTVRSIKLPQERMIKRINLKFAANLVIAGGSGAGAPETDAVSRLIRSIEVVGDGSTTLFRRDGRGLYFENLFEAGCPPYVLDPADDAAATYPIGINLDIWFANNIGIRPVDTLLAAPRFRTLELRINWGEIDDMFTAAADYTSATISSAYGFRPVVYETTEPVDVPFIRFHDWIEKEVTATTNEFTIDLPVGNRIYQKAMIMTLDALERESDIIDLTDVILGESFRPYQELPFVQMQQQGEKDFHLEAIPAGLEYLYMLEDGRIPSGLNVSLVNTAKFKHTVTVGAGTTLIRTYLDYVMPSG